MNTPSKIDDDNDDNDEKATLKSGAGDKMANEQLQLQQQQQLEVVVVEDDDDDDGEMNSVAGGELAIIERDERILNNITGYLTFTTTSTTPLTNGRAHVGPPPFASPLNYSVHSASTSTSMNGPSWSTIRTPATPGLVSISPLVGRLDGDCGDSCDAEGDYNEDYGNYYFEEEELGPHHDYHDGNADCIGSNKNSVSSGHNNSANIKRFVDDGYGNNEEDSYHRSQWEKHIMIDRQRKLAANIFAHQQPLRSYCLDAYHAAQEVQQTLLQQRKRLQRQPTHDESPETLVEPANENEFQYRYNGRQQQQLQQQQQQYPLRRRGGASRMERGACQHQYQQEHRDMIALIFSLVHHVFDNVPLSVAGDLLGGCREVALDSSFATVRITSMTMNGIAGTVFRAVGGVWDGVTSFNPVNFAHFVITRPFNMMGRTTEVVVSGIQSVATGVGSASSLALHRLSAKPSSGSLISQTSGLRRLRSPAVSKKLLKKLSSLNSAATVLSYKELDDNTGGLSRQAMSRVQRMMHYDVSLRPFMATVRLEDSFKRSLSTVDGTAFDGHSVASSSSTPLDSPFMCTPQSFPPTPVSRRMVLARGSRHAADVVYLARDQLRVNDGLESENERTREMAQALTQGKRLAVFDAEDASGGIDLTCGQHVATKVGNQLYCSTRSMIPILRNCFVYFEMTVLPRHGGDLLSQTTMATLSVGLSTKEMPPNTLTGAWKGSIGLCTTGQVLVAGQWTAPDPTLSAFGDSSTIGVLCCLDDSSAFQTWDGTVVNASVTFNIDGHIVRPPVTNIPAPAPTTDESCNTTQQTSSSLPTGGPVPPSFNVPLLVPAEEELYPTLTLHHPGMSVMCRFSAGDILAQSREAIGAPTRQPIFTIDGSIVFDEETD